MPLRILVAVWALTLLAASARAGDIAVTSDADTGPGSLRAALVSAATGDRILVALPGDHRVALGGALPPLAGAVTLDFGDAPGTLTIAGQALALTQGLAVSLGPRRSVVLEIVIEGSGGVALAGGGTLVLARAESYLGDTTIAAGKLRLAAGGSLPAIRRLVIDGGAFDLGEANSRIGGLAGNGGEIILGDRTLTVDQDNDTTFAGSISGRGRLVKEGPGRLTLAAPQAWTGGTTVAGGVLELAAGGAHGLSGPIEVRGGALLAPGVTIGGGRK